MEVLYCRSFSPEKRASEHLKRNEQAFTEVATAAAAAVSAADGAKMVEALTDVAMTMAAVASSREVWSMVMATEVGRQ